MKKRFGATVINKDRRDYHMTALWIMFWMISFVVAGIYLTLYGLFWLGGWSLPVSWQTVWFLTGLAVVFFEQAGTRAQLEGDDR